MVIHVISCYGNHVDGDSTLVRLEFIHSHKIICFNEYNLNLIKQICKYRYIFRALDLFIFHIAYHVCLNQMHAHYLR